jgi:hypothetical protein
MGGASYNSADFTIASLNYTDTVKRKGGDFRKVLNTECIKDYLNPKTITVRESRDSENHPATTAIIVGLDVSGSMGRIAHEMAGEHLQKLFEGIIDKKPTDDPHIMLMAIGDVEAGDDAPLQATQFESDVTLTQQLKDLYIEGGGGGNQHESYHLPWYFAAAKTSIDCWEKRKKKGYLFTIGDEMPPEGLDRDDMNTVFGKGPQMGYSRKQLLEMAQKTYNVFHVIVEQGDFASRQKEAVYKNWQALLGKRALRLLDYRHLSQVILSAIQVEEGQEPEDVITQWQEKEVQKSVRYALYGGGQ